MSAPKSVKDGFSLFFVIVVLILVLVSTLNLIAAAGKVYFLVDHTKFGIHGPIRLGELDICDVLITDREPEPGFTGIIRAAKPEMDIVIAE